MATKGVGLLLAIASGVSDGIVPFLHVFLSVGYLQDSKDVYSLAFRHYRKM